MTRRIAPLALVGLGAALWTARSAPVVEERPPSEAPSGAASARATAPERASPLAPPAPVPARDAAFAAHLAATADGCDLPATRWCDEGGCAAVLTSPDLDGPLGWLRALADRPGLVAGVAARDLGLPAGVEPCGGALGAAGLRVFAVEPAGADEVWCAAPSGGPDDLARCAAAARAALGAELSFEGARELRFAR